MEENTKVDKEVIEKDKDKDTLVVDENNRVIDFDAILNENKDEAIVNNINNLLNCGSNYVSREVIKERFAEKTGAMVTEEIAMNVLQEVFDEFVNLINNNDEFVMVSGKDGKIDKVGTEKKLRENAEYLLNNRDEEENINKILGINKEEKTIDSIFKTPEHMERKRIAIEEAFKEVNNEEKYVEERNNFQVTEENVGVSLFKQFNNSLEMLKKYSKEELILIEYDKKLEEAKGTVRYDDILKERNDFLKSRPDIEKKLIDPETGRVRKEDYKANEAQLVVGIVQEIACLKESGINNLDENRKKIAVIHIISGLEVDEIKDDVSKMLAELIPDYKAEEGNSINNRKSIENMLGIKEALHEEGFQALLRVCGERILRDIDIEVILQNNGIFPEYLVQKWFDNSAEELDVANLKEDIKTAEMKYFKGSSLEFLEEDAKLVKEAYNTSTARSWINTKEDAINYRYAYLLKSKQELESRADTSGIAFARLLSVNEELEKFEEKYGKLELEDKDGKFSSKLNYYADSKVLSKLSKEFIKDEDKITTRADYDKLSPEEKKIYLRNTIVALNYEKESVKSKTKLSSSKKIMNKFAKRRLEILNIDENQFITINGDDIQINTDVIFNEYQKMSRHNFKDYQELSDYCELNKMEYVNDKLKICIELDDSCFEKVSQIGKSYEKATEEIEKLKAKNYNKENFFGNVKDSLKGKIDESDLEQLQLSEEILNRIKYLDTKINSEDVFVMEFQRLQNQIEFSQGLDHNMAIKQRSELIRKNPDKKSDFLKCANNSNKYKNSLKLYTDAIVEKNALITVAVINSLSDEKLNYLINSPDLKNKTLLTLVASLKENPETEQSQLISAIQKICPNTKMTDKNGKLVNDFDKLAPRLGKELEIESCSKSELTSLIDKTKTIIVQNQNAQRLDNVEEKDLVMALGINGLSILSDKYLNSQDADDINKTREEKFFEGSKLEYSKNDVDEFKRLYCKTLSKSWVESKEQAQNLRYMHLVKAKEAALKSPLFTDKQKEIFVRRVENYEEEHPNLKKEDFIENGKLKLEKKREIEEFENMKFVGDLLSDYVMDEEKVDCPKDYKNLTLSEKRKYIVATLQGLMEEKEDNNILAKMALRRLEVISDSDKSFVIDDKENGIKLNEEALVKEFSSIYKLRKDIKTFDDLKEIYAHRRTAHARSKLKFYDEVSDEFIQLNSKDNESRAKEIEKHKADIALKKSLDYEKYLNPVVEAAKAKEISSKENENKSSEKESKYSYNFSKAQEENYDIRKSKIGNSETLVSSGIKIETIDVDKKLEYEITPNSSKQDTQFQEVLQDEQQQENTEHPKLSFVDRIKNAISNFRKPIEENTDELALVETKGGFFDNIKNAMKNIFAKNEDKMEVEDVQEQESTQIQNTFDQRYKVDVDRSKAINSLSTNKTLQESNRETEEDKDDVSYGE